MMTTKRGPIRSESAPQAMLATAIAMVAGHSIRYVHEASTLGRYTVLVYAVVALLPFFLSTTKLVRTIGATFVVALVVTIVMYREALTSVWCGLI